MHLTEAFLAGRGGATEEGLEASLAALVAEARAEVPGLEVAAFLRHVGQRLKPGVAVGALHARDLALTFACAAGDAGALAQLERRYLGDLPAILAGARVDPGALAELPQLLRTQLLMPVGSAPPRIADYGGRGPFSRWLRITALRAASKLRRTDQARDAAEKASEPDQLAAFDPELLLIRQRFQKDFSEAFREASARLQPEERNVLRLHYVDGVTVGQLSVLLHTSRATAGRRLFEARDALVAATVAGLQARLQLEPGELQSLLGAVRSRLHLSFSALLSTPA